MKTHILLIFLLIPTIVNAKGTVGVVKSVNKSTTYLDIYEKLDKNKYLKVYHQDDGFTEAFLLIEKDRLKFGLGVRQQDPSVRLEMDLWK